MLKNHKDSHNFSGTSPSPQDQSGQNDASNDWQIFKTRCQPVTKDHHVSCCAVCWFPNFKLEFQNHLYNSFICNRDKGTPATGQAPPVGLVQNYQTLVNWQTHACSVSCMVTFSTPFSISPTFFSIISIYSFLMYGNLEFKLQYFTNLELTVLYSCYLTVF